MFEGRRIAVRADDGEAAKPVLLGALDRAGAGVTTETVARPSLDDVCLRYAGRSCSEAEAAGTEGASSAAEIRRCGPPENVRRRLA